MTTTMVNYTSEKPAFLLLLLRVFMMAIPWLRARLIGHHANVALGSRSGSFGRKGFQMFGGIFGWVTTGKAT